MKCFWQRVFLSISLLLFTNTQTQAATSIPLSPLPIPNQQDHFQEEVLVTAQPDMMIQMKDAKAFYEKLSKTASSYLEAKPQSQEQRVILDTFHTFYCTGFVRQVYRECNIWLPAHSLSTLSRYGVRLQNTKSLVAGDLVFLSRENHPHEIGHVFLSIGNGELLHPDDTKGTFSSVSFHDPLIQKRLLFVTRIVH